MKPTKLIQDFAAAITTDDLLAALEREDARDQAKIISYEVFLAKRTERRKSSKAA